MPSSESLYVLMLLVDSWAGDSEMIDLCCLSIVCGLLVLSEFVRKCVERVDQFL